MKKVALNLLVKYLEEMLEVKNYPDYCENGLQVAGRDQVGKVAVAVTASQAVIVEAARLQADALLVHHGLFWKNTPYSLDAAKVGRLKPLLAHDISLLAYHLPLDGHKEVGNNWKAAKELGWNDLQVFEGFGVIGSFAAMPIEALVAVLERHFQHKAMTALFGPKMVSKAAFLSGGGYSYFPQAVKAGVDVYITGNFDEPAWWVAQEGKTHFVALGHYATEKTGVQTLAKALEKEFGLETFFIDAPNPF